MFRGSGRRLRHVALWRQRRDAAFVVASENFQGVSFNFWLMSFPPRLALRIRVDEIQLYRYRQFALTLFVVDVLDVLETCMSAAKLFFLGGLTPNSSITIDKVERLFCDARICNYIVTHRAFPVPHVDRCSVGSCLCGPIILSNYESSNTCPEAHDRQELRDSVVVC